MEKLLFVNWLWPHLRGAISKGFASNALLAQVAVETGWGEHINKFPDGTSSNNLFNITAGKSWKGKTCFVNTHEFKNGKRVAMARAFRAYDSLEESVSDYCHLIETYPVYRRAFAERGNVVEYCQALQDAGYATAPSYAAALIATAGRMPLPVVRATP